MTTLAWRDVRPGRWPTRRMPSLTEIRIPGALLTRAAQESLTCAQCQPTRATLRRAGMYTPGTSKVTERTTGGTLLRTLGGRLDDAVVVGRARARWRWRAWRRTRRKRGQAAWHSAAPQPRTEPHHRRRRDQCLYVPRLAPLRKLVKGRSWLVATGETGLRLGAIPFGDDRT
jgi:hypothetical protein